MARRCTHIREKGGFFWWSVYFSWCQSRCTRGREGDSGDDEHESEMECELLLLPSSSFLAPPSLFFTFELAFHLQQSRRIWRGEEGFVRSRVFEESRPPPRSSSSPPSPSTSSSGESCWLLLSSCLEPGEDSPTEKDVKTHLYPPFVVILFLLFV